ncbi:MAG TPA: hypothetical protein VIH57_15590 [Bacteroidales bacterium]
MRNTEPKTAKRILKSKIYHLLVNRNILSKSPLQVNAGWLFIPFLLICNIAFSQTPIKKEVEVVKPYEPVVSDAYKINILPKINDSVTIKPIVQYSITPTMLNTEYQVNPINAARMLSMPLQKLYKSYLKLGFGNYTTPLAEAYIGSLRSKTHSVGFFFRHQSSAGKVTLDNDAKVNAGYSETSGELFGKKFFKSSYLYGDGSLSGNTVFRYGYDPKITDTVLEKGDIRQNYLLAKLNVGLRSTNSDSSKLNYHVDLGYNYFRDRVNHAENNIDINGQFSKRHKTSMLGLNASYDLLKPNSILDSTKSANSLLGLNPWVGFSTSDYRLQLGLNMCFENQDNTFNLRLYPDAEFQFIAVKDVIIPFLGLTGGVKNHSYRDIAYENPFIRPDLKVRNSNMKLNFYGGLKGSLGAKASYVLKFDYSSLDDQYFFMNDTSTVLRNQFTVVYSSVDIFTEHAEVNYDVSDHLTLGLKTNFYQYNLVTEQQAWHRPSYDMALSARYNLRNKILVDFDILGLGKRYAKEFAQNSTNPTIKELPSVLDFNLGLEYRYTKILSVWLKFNNFTASKYYVWNQYPSQRFNLMAGFTYSL